ncbi:UDP-N-acetylmuramoyl-L-alanine--D-glutamate ligase [Patescibacteria group bacterium]|nr:UDP-N-acetylmuramoyl-L-alanine--D-glutamate ligase [Patescibacteria group bacterium]
MIAEKNKNLKIALLGFGLDNQALLKLLLKKGELREITICDKRPKELLAKIETRAHKNIKINYRLGPDFNRNLFDFDILFRSPGWPIACPGVQEALKNDSYLSSALDIFFRLCPTKNIIGVTGTKGKGTTATLIYKIISDYLKDKKVSKKTKTATNNKARAPKVWLGGNIGLSPLNFLEKIKENDFVILELSSFQLEDLKVSPKISVITNLYKEHLAPADPNNPNFHKSFDAYFKAKLNIALNKENKVLIINQSLKEKFKTYEKLLSSKKSSKKTIYFKATNLKTKIKGDYNQENISAAIEVAKTLKIPETIYEKTIANFKNLEHRLELVRELNKIKFFNNSFSTTPESTELDLLSFGSPIIQLAGGADKGASFKNLAKTIKKKVKFLILFPGEGGKKIENELNKINFPKEKIIKVKSMEEAISQAYKKAEANDIILLSTACASFGLFKNYKERGNLFKAGVKKLK